MGRSVDYLTNAKAVTYFCLEGSEDELEREMEWEDLFGNIKYSLMRRYPSLDEANSWDGNETKIFLENSLVHIGISEYCGLVSVSIRTNDRNWEYESLAENFIDRTWDNMVKLMRGNTYHEPLVKVGTFSNGNSIFEKA